jgi:hypothetical protein
MARARNVPKNEAWTKNRAHPLYPIPTLPPPTATTPIILCVPDDQAWRSLLWKALGNLSWWLSYQRDDSQSGKQTADAWLTIIREAQMIAINGTASECMDWCQVIADCINDSDNTQEAIRNFITNDTQIRNVINQMIAEQTYGTKYPPEQPLPITESTRNIIDLSADCNYDVLYAKCLAFVQVANTFIVDFFEAWELFTNQGEVLSALASGVPIVNLAAAETGVQLVIDYANMISDSLKENYDGDYTLVYEQELACELFCAAKPSCQFTLDDMCNIINARVGSSLTLSTAAELILSLIDLDVTGLNVADLYMCMFFNMLKLANAIVPIDWGIEKFQLFIDIVDSGNNDWEILCVDCPPETPLTPVITSLWDTTRAVGTLTGPDGFGVWTVTTVYRGTDNAFVLMASDGSQFKLVDIVYSSIPSCQVFSTAGTPTYIACVGTNAYTTQTLDEFWSTWPSGSGDQTMTFRMLTP